MKSLFFLMLLFVLCSSNSIAQSRYSRELPIIADRVVDVSRQMFESSKGKSQILVSGDQNWNIGHGDLHCNGAVYAIEPQYDQKDYVSYVGGAFDSIDGIQLRGIARLEWGDFVEIGGGVSAGAVYAIADDSANLFVAGNFKQAGSTPVQNIARWDGSTWHALGLGTDSTVLALCVHNDILYVGGNFTNAGGASANYLAAYDIQKDEWKPIVASGVNGLNGGISALESDGTVLYVGGGFTKAGSTSANKIVVYTGSEWVDIGGASGENSYVATIAAFENEIYVGGSFDTVGQVAANNIARYHPNLEVWNPIGVGFDGPVNCISVPADQSWVPFVACGDFKYSGTTEVNNIAAYAYDQPWGPWGSGLDNVAYALRTNRYYMVAFQSQENSVLVGGKFTTAGGKSSPNFAIHYEPAKGVEEREQGKLTFDIFPNPISKDLVRAKITLPKTASITLSIVDALGREVTVLAKNEVIATKEYSFDPVTLANGVYYCLLQTEGLVQVRKIVISH